MFTKVSGRMTKLMGMELIYMRMELDTVECGSMTNRMEWEKKSGLMDHLMKEGIMKGKNKEEGSLSGLMDLIILENGKIIRCMVKGFSFGWMAGNLKETTSMIESKVMESLSGQMGECMRGNG
jgi:hypothetical protein